MKRKLLTVFLALIAALCLCCGLAACGGGSTEGTYYLVQGDEYDKETYFVLKNGEWTDEDGASGEYEVNGDKITLYTDMFGTKMEFMSGTIKDGVLTLSAVYGDKVFAKEGAWKDASGSGNSSGSQGSGSDSGSGSQGSGSGNSENNNQVGSQDDTLTKKQLSYTLSDDKSYYTVTGIGTLTGDIEVPDEWEGKPVKAIAASAFANSNTLTSIQIGKNIKTVGEKAFYKCTALTNVILGENVASIEKSTFEQCENLKKITIPLSVMQIKQNAFEGCKALAEIHYTGSVSTWASIDFWYSDADWTRTTANPLFGHFVGYASRVLYIDNKPITTVEISSVTEIKPTAFYGYDALKSVTIGGKITKIGDSAFSWCNNLIEASFEDFTQTVEIEYGAFYNCDSLQNITLSDEVVSVGDRAFMGCEKLKSVTIGNGVTEIGYNTFQSCKLLSSLTLGNSLEKIDENAFAFCEALTTVTIPASVGFIGKYAFDYTSLQTAYFENTDGWKINNGIGKVHYVDVEGLDDPQTAAKLLILDPLSNGYVGNDWLKPDVIDTDAHTHEWDDEWVISKPATCETAGEMTCTCKTNNTHIKRRTIPALGHTFDNYVPNGDATCTKNETETGKCIRCEETDTRPIPNSALGHKLVFHKGYDATCTESGRVDYNTCERCDYQSVSSIDIPAHHVQYKKNGDTYSVTGISSQCKDSEIIFPESYMGKPVTSIAANAFKNCTSLEKITIPNSVTSIGEYAFYGCDGLTSVTIGGGVTSIGKYAFCGCDGLTSVTIGNSVTSIENGSFDGCSSLTSITIPDSVTSIGKRAFYDCSGLESVTIGSDVASIGERAFEYCRGLNSVIWNAKNCTSAGSRYNLIFSGCTSLSSVTFGKEVKTIPAYAFKDCSRLTSIIIPDSVTSIGDCAFEGCSGMTSVTIGSGMKSIGDSAFSGCHKLVEVWNYSGLNIVEGYTGNGCVAYYAKRVYTTDEKSRQTVTDEGYIFCEGINYGEIVCLLGYSGNKTNLTLPAKSPQNEEYAIYKYAFYGCSSLESITIPDNVVSIGGAAFNGCSGLTSIVIPDSVTSIGDEAFSGCSELTSIIIPDSVTSIGDEAFSGTAYYKDESHWDDSGVLYICNQLIEAKDTISATYTIRTGTKTIADHAFYDCYGLTSITIPDSVTSIGDGAFHECYKLIEVWNFSDLPIVAGKGNYGDVAYYAKHVYTTDGKSKQTVTDEGYIFYEDSEEIYLLGYSGNETNLTLPAKSPQNKDYAIYQYAFYECTSLESITIPDSVTSIKAYAFSGCSKLTSVTIGSSVTEIGDCAFSYCYKLTSVTIGSGVISIGDNAFHGCSGLESVTIGSSVTSIGDYAFWHCSGLTSITIPNSVTKIGYYAFWDCSGLTDIQFKGTVKEWQAIQTDSYWNRNTSNYTITCTDGTINKNGNVTYFEQ